MTSLSPEPSTAAAAVPPTNEDHPGRSRNLRGQTSVQIPCCLCGTLILPNAANQCPTCLSQSFNLQSILQRGPGNADHVTIHQCRRCRRFQRSEHRYEACDMESPELLALCLKQIPALQTNSGNNHTHYSKIQLIDAHFVWTEPHSMRLKLHLTVRTLVQGVTLQQRVQTWLKIQFSQCSDCNREYTHRTWQAIVQIRQKRSYDTTTNTLSLLEMALAKNTLLRQDVLQMDSVSQGFDFYFLSYRKAQIFASGLQKILPCRMQTTRKMVSEDIRNSTANMKYTLLLELVPLCRHDLVVLDRSAAAVGPLSGRLALVHKLGSGAIHCIPVNPPRLLPSAKSSHVASSGAAAQPLSISQEAYYKHEKAIHVLQSHKQMVEFIVLDVELWNQEEERKRNQTVGENGTGRLPSGAKEYYQRWAMADVQVVRSDGAGDEVMDTVTHLGLLLQPGDVVLGYDLMQSTHVQQDELLRKSLHSNVVVPDILLVKKVKGGGAAAAMNLEENVRENGPSHEVGAKPRMSKAKERRRRRDQGKKAVQLEESAMRMGLLGESSPMNAAVYEDDDDDDDDGETDWTKELSELEREMANLDAGEAMNPDENDEVGEFVENSS